MFQKCNYQVARIEGVSLPGTLTQEEEDMYNAMMSLPGIADEANFQVYQFWVEAKRQI